MTYRPGDPGHLQAHADVVIAVNFELDRFGLADDLPIKNTGDEGHLDDHNAIRAKLELIETTAGRTFGTPLPPVRNLGDPGHVDDHTALLACALEASLWPAWNDATGGTITTVDNYNGTGEKWRVHTFTGSGSLNVALAVQPFRVLLVAGGGAGGNHSVSGSVGAGGGGGVIVDDALALSAQQYSVVVGAGASAPGNYNGGASGGNSTFAGLTAIGGGGGAGEYRRSGLDGGSGGGSQNHDAGAGNPGKGTPPQGTDGSGNGSSGGYAGNPVNTAGVAWTVARGTRFAGSSSPATNYGDGGQGNVSNGGGGYAGKAGVVVVAYQIG